MELLEIYEKCTLRWQDKLEYINDLWYDFNSIDWLRTKIKEIRKEKWVSPWNGQSYFKQKLEEVWMWEHNWSNGWLKVDWASIHIKNDKEFDWDKVIQWIMDKISLHSINYEKYEYKQIKDGHCLILDLADHHFGKYASPKETNSPYDLNLASFRFKAGVEWVIQKAQGFPIERVIFVIWNDVLHIDTKNRTTTWWTPQDTDWMWYEAFEVALASYIETIEKITTIAPVEVIYNPSNHDFMSGYMLAETLKAWFNANDNITWNIWPKHRKYTKFWTSMLWFNHWDWANDKDMIVIMATEEPLLWSKTKFRYIYQHHIHHRVTKDYIWWTIQYLRSASWTDSWHNMKWYIGLPATDAFIISQEHWQIAHLTHYY